MSKELNFSKEDHASLQESLVNIYKILDTNISTTEGLPQVEGSLKMDDIPLKMTFDITLETTEEDEHDDD